MLAATRAEQHLQRGSCGVNGGHIRLRWAFVVCRTRPASCFNQQQLLETHSEHSAALDHRGVTQRGTAPPVGRGSYPVSSPDTCYKELSLSYRETSFIFGFRDSLAHCCYKSTQMTFVNIVEVKNTDFTDIMRLTPLNSAQVPCLRRGRPSDCFSV